MQRRQSSIPRQWLVADTRAGSGRELLQIVRRLPRGCGILLLYRELRHGERKRLAQGIARLARMRGLVLAEEGAGGAARVHSARELTRARVRRAKLLFLSPMHPTRSHPDWRPLPRMRAAALTRLAGAPVLALGGMNAKRFEQLEPLGFHGWAGIDAWIRT